MSTTLNWLETYNQAGLALSLIVEGFGTVFATTAMPSTYSADADPYDQWNDPTGGLHIVGSISESIDMYAQDVDSSTLEFKITDPSGALLGQLFRSAYSSGHKTYLTSSVVAGSTATWNVKDTTGFASSGTLYCGDEAVSYTGKTGTTFTGITRAVFGANTTNGGARFSAGHTIGLNVTAAATTAPAVTDYPRTWVGRFCHLLLHVKDPLTGQYNLPSEATRIWSGRLLSYRDEPDGTICISADSAHGLLKRAVGGQQWQGTFPEGVRLDNTQDWIAVSNSSAGGTGAYKAQTQLGFTNTNKSHADVATAINAQFETWESAGTTKASDLWSCTLIDSGNNSTVRYRIRLECTTATPIGSGVVVELSPEVLNLLGWPRGTAGTVYNVSGDQVCQIRLARINDSLWEVIAPEAPIVYYNKHVLHESTMNVENQSGTFTTQTVTDADSITMLNTATNGIVMVEGGAYDGRVFAVKYTAGSPTATLKFYGRLDMETGDFVNTNTPTEMPWDYIRAGDAASAPRIKQVWLECGGAGTVLLKQLLSTGGASGYNHSTYDVRTAAGHGCSVPASLVDVASFLDLDDVKVLLLIDSPRPFYELLEPVLQASGRYVVWKASAADAPYRLTIIRPTLDNSTKLAWTLDETNKADSLNGPDRTTVDVAADGVINRIIVRYGYGLRGDANQAKVWVVDDIASQSDYGRRRTLELKCPGITNVEEIAPQTLAPALAYFSRPLAIATRSYNASLMRMSPGDAVSVVDNFVVNPETGTRGAVLYGWVLSTDFDLRTGRGRARIVFLPERLPRVAQWGPSARVDETAGGGGYNGVATLTTKLHEFSHSAEDEDALNFVNGDFIHIYELDNASPLEWYRTVNGGPSSNAITFSGGVLAGWDSTKRYVVELGDVTNVSASRRTQNAFIADDVDNSTGAVIPTAYDWGQAAVFSPTYGTSLAAISYSKGMFEPSTTQNDKGEPVSVHKQRMLVDAANNLLAYKTRGPYLNRRLPAAGTQTGTTTKLVFCAWVPIYGTAARGFDVQLHIKTSSGTGTFTVRSSPKPPKGTGFTGHSFPGGSTSLVLTTTSTTLEWKSGALDASVHPGSSESGLLGTWITVEASGSGGGVTASLSHVFVCEGEL